MDQKKMPAAERVGAVDMKEWTDLGARLVVVGPVKFEQLLDALRKIVDAQEAIAQFDWQLFLRSRPTKRYQA